MGDAHEFVCPLHRHFIQDCPGSCGLCGVKLVKQETALYRIDRNKLLHRFWDCLLLTLCIISLVINNYFPTPKLNPWLQAVCATPLVFYCAAPFFAQSMRSIRKRRLNLISLAIFGIWAAYFFSIIELLLPASLRMSAHFTPYFESVAVITLLLIASQVIAPPAQVKSESKVQETLDPQSENERPKPKYINTGPFTIRTVSEKKTNESHRVRSARARLNKF